MASSCLISVDVPVAEGPNPTPLQTKQGASDSDNVSSDENRPMQSALVSLNRFSEEGRPGSNGDILRLHGRVPEVTPKDAREVNQAFDDARTLAGL